MNLLHFVVITLVIYMPFHLFEEALGNFPKWMYEQVCFICEPWATKDK